MKKSIATFISISLLSAVGLAKQVFSSPNSYSNMYNGPEAKAVFDAAAGAGLKAVTYDKLPAYTEYEFDQVTVQIYNGSHLDPSDVCFNTPSYSVTLVDTLDHNTKVSIDESASCTATKAKGMAEALSGVGGAKVMDCAMGECGFVASDVRVSRDLTRTGDDIYKVYLIVGVE